MIYSFEIVKKYIQPNIISEIESDFEKYQNTELSSLGIDSLSFFQVVLEIEEICNLKLDYINLDIKQFSTLKKIDQFIEEYKHEL